ncbi:MAG: class I SAM-dependent RNA methyltransferase [Bryobacteraceae bacterium]
MELQVQIEKMVYGGDGLARAEGQVVLAPFVLPGELVTVESQGSQKGVLRGRIASIDTPSAERQSAPCRVFRRCGGCHYQQAPYATQLHWKQEIVRELFRRVGKMSAPEEMPLISAEPWEYRNRVQLHTIDGSVGFLETGSRTLCPVSTCPISSPRINQAIAALAAMARDTRWPRFLRSLELFTNEEQVQLNVLETERPLARWFFDWCEESMPGASAPLEYPTRDFTFRTGGRSFFQVNRFLIDTLVDTALAGASGDMALDLYAGVGLFTLPLAKRFRSVTAVESGNSAVRDLEFNAQRAGVAVDIRRANTEDFLEEFAGSCDYVLADPPRTGLGKRVVKRLLDLHPRRVVIVSCDPATLARDLAPLLAGGYGMERLVLVDLFPQTFHIEVIADLALR